MGGGLDLSASFGFRLLWIITMINLGAGYARARNILCFQRYPPSFLKFSSPLNRPLECLPIKGQFRRDVLIKPDAAMWHKAASLSLRTKVTLSLTTRDDNHLITSSDGANKRLDYEHGFHAGNFADVFKHVILVMLFQHMTKKKGKPIGYVETHAGAGLYHLSLRLIGEELLYEAEFQRGIGRLLSLQHNYNATTSTDYPIESMSSHQDDPISTYLDIVRSFQNQSYNKNSPTLVYPGSPLLAASFLGQQKEAQDKQGKEQSPHHSMLLYEKAPYQCELLREHLQHLNDNFSNDSLNIACHCDNGYTELARHAQSTAKLPPRALILMDPPYQYGSDTDQILALCQTLQRHWRSARIAIWHPVRRGEAARFQRQRLYQLLSQQLQNQHKQKNTKCDILIIEVLPPHNDSTATATAGGDSSTRKDDVGTGMILIQPPYGMEESCHTILPRLLHMLQPDLQLPKPEYGQHNETTKSIRIEWL